MLWRLRNIIENTTNQLLFTLGVYSNGLPQKIQHSLGLPLVSREHIPLLVKSLKLDGDAVEIGVFEGKFSEHILKYTKLHCLFGIDPWLEFETKEYFDKANNEQSIQDQHFEDTKNKLKKFKERSKIIRKNSEDASLSFKDNSLDFIYIDGDHSYEGCKENLELWWPKLKAGGLIAGDDYVNLDTEVTDYGVELAVTEFFITKTEEVRLTKKLLEVHWPNWYVVKE